MTFFTIGAVNKDIKAKEISGNHFYNILIFLDFLPNFLFTTSEMKRDELPNELRNDLRLKILGNYEKPEKFQNLIEF